MISGTAGSEQTYYSPGGAALTGDVTGAPGANTVEKIRGGNVPAPGAGQDGKAFYWDQSTGAWIYGIPPVVQSALDAKARLASPALTGNPTAPTQSPGDNTTKLATTAFVTAAAGGGAAPDATTTVKGINKMSVAPVSAASPIAVGDNDPRVAAATAAQLGIVKVSGTIVDAANPTVRSADDFQKQSLTTALTAITANTTLGDLTGLDVAIGTSATELWIVEYFLIVNGANATMDIKFGMTFPTGLQALWGASSPVISSGTPFSMVNQTQQIIFGTGTTRVELRLIAHVLGGGTAGTLRLQYAQNVSDAGNLIIDKWSCVTATRLRA